MVQKWRRRDKRSRDPLEQLEPPQEWGLGAGMIKKNLLLPTSLLATTSFKVSSVTFEFQLL